MTDPVSRTILLFDIERFSDRDDIEQNYLRRMLYDIADRTLTAAGIGEDRRIRADRGDAVMELIDSNASVTALLRALLTETPVQLHGVNRMASSSAQIRLRAVLATGYVAIDERNGWVGSDLNHACRLLDGDVLRAALRERTGDLALCVSEDVHRGIVRHGHPGIVPEEFRPVTVSGKNGPMKAWLHGTVPGAGTAAAEYGAAAAGSGEAAYGGAAAGSPEGADGGSSGGPAPGTAGGAVFHFHGGAPSFAGGLAGRDQHGVSGGHVGGDVVLGSTGDGRPGNVRGTSPTDADGSTDGGAPR
ncbi:MULTISPECIES: hypothetical protein [unclassified Streptomyces]|uniref:hypothetical protein n=1 Tax=unclassified Streptomyces TaxID=2593676 RepID=UPI0006CE1278|nr:MULTISPECIES: hypothetical protein [unclassified Streptomyces]KPC80021.1 hypothetical protein ADK82_21320 [Streptomyces sp. NRRL S-4]